MCACQRPGYNRAGVALALGHFARWLTAVLAAVALIGSGMLAVRLRPYWIAKYHGEKADLRGAMLVRAPLHGAHLREARLQRTDLRGADLRRADLQYAQLQRA